MIPHRRQSVEGRAAAKSSGWYGGSRSYRKTACSGEGRGAYSHIHERETTGGGGGENDTPPQRAVLLSGTRRESTGMVVGEEQKRTLEEEFLFERFGEGEEWRRKDRELLNLSPQPLVEPIFLNDEEEDGVHGGRMKPLTSFDLNRGMPPQQNRRLKIKLSSTEDNPSSTTDGAAPKGIRSAQDKENGGLVPLCPGTTQIRGMKRKIVSPTELKPQGGKRARPPHESAKTADESRKGPDLEEDGDGSQGMDMLLMALAADPNQRLISPSQPMARMTVVHPTTGDQAVKPARPTLRVRTAEAPFCRSQVQSKVLREGPTASREEELRAPGSRNQATMQYPQVKRRGNVDFTKGDDEDLSCSDKDDDLTPEEFEKKYGPIMKPHRYRPAPLKDTLVKINKTVDLTKDEDLSCSDDEYDLTPEELARKYGTFMKPHRYRPAPCQTAPLEDALVNVKERLDVRKDDHDLSCSDDECELSPDQFEREFGTFMRPHRYKLGPHQTAPLKDVLVEGRGGVEERKELLCSHDNVEATVRISHKHQQATVTLARDKIKGIVDVIKEDDEDSSSSDDKDLCREDFDRKYGPCMRPHRYMPAPLKDTLDKTKDSEESIGRGQDLLSTEDSLEKNGTRERSYCMISREALDNPEESLEASSEEDDDSKCNEARLDWKMGDGATNACVLEIQRQVVTTGKAFPDSLSVARTKLFGPSANSVDGRRENRGEKSSCDANIIETVITPGLSNVHPSQARSLWSQERNINPRVLKECRITGLNCSTSAESHQLQHKVSEREPTGHDSRYVISLREDFDTEIVEKSHSVNQEHDFRHFLPSTWGKYSGARQQFTRKELSGAPMTTYDQQLPNTKKRKASGRNSAFCIVPKQVKLATASCLIDNGESSHPSVGAVVVECLPPSTEHKKDNRAPFSEFQNKDAAVSSSYNSFQSPVEVGIWDTDKENISCVRDTASDRPSSAGVKVPCIQDFEVITTDQKDASSLHRSGLSSVGRVSGSITLGDTSSRLSLHTEQNSRTDVAHAARPDSKTFDSSGSQYGSRVQQLQQQQRPRSTQAGSGTCTSNENNETRHEIAGITMQRRSWEALKSAKYFAKRRFDPNTETVYDNNYVPFIPSRFQNAEYPVQRVSNVKPKPDFETQLGHGATLSRSIGVTTLAGIAERRVTFRRGPKQGKQERLSTKVLNRNLEHFVQLNDASCSRGNAFGRLDQTLNGGHFPVDVSQPQFPLPRSYSVVPKVPSQKARQRRGPKKFGKERLKTIITKTTSSSCQFKSLSEPSGLLGSLNPGIIGRVRNSQQIHAILGALIGVASGNEGREATRYASLPRVSQGSACVPVKPEAAGELNEKPVEAQETFLKEENISQPKNGADEHSAAGRSTENEKLQERDFREETLDQGQPLLSNGEQCDPLEMTTEIHEILPECAAGLASLRDEAVKGGHLREQSESRSQMLSSLSGNPEDVEDDNEQELQLVSVTDSSSAAAGLAARWLELLSLDAKGRLSALKRSRRRVQSTLLSGPLNPNVISANPSSTRSAVGMDVLGSQQSVCSDATTIQTLEDESSQQVDRWRALFTNMDVVLGNEATKLESWLWQINQMQAFCPSSTQQASSGPEKSHVSFCQGLAASNSEMERQPPQRWPLTIDAIEKELGFAASAASMTSTANFVAKVQNFR